MHVYLTGISQNTFNYVDSTYMALGKTQYNKIVK